MNWKTRIQDPRRLNGVKTRRTVEKKIREFFNSRDFEEVRTPLLVSSPGMEPHIRPIEVIPRYESEDRLFLPTSPEFAMKKLLAGGLKKIYQICPAFRDEPKSRTHLCEFTLLEWYETQCDLEGLMKTTEFLVESLAKEIHGMPRISYQGHDIDVSTPWPRLKIRDLFKEYVDIDLVQENTIEKLSARAKKLGIDVDYTDTWDDLYFKIWLNLIEPKLPMDRAFFVYRYPASQAALSVLDTDADGSKWSKRAEFYIAGLELGNGFEELTDAKEQRRRFEEDMDLREKIYGEVFPRNPIDEDFIQALEEGLPPCSGIAVGVDRLILLFANETDIDYTFYLT